MQATRTTVRRQRQQQQRRKWWQRKQQQNYHIILLLLLCLLLFHGCKSQDHSTMLVNDDVEISYVLEPFESTFFKSSWNYFFVGNDFTNDTTSIFNDNEKQDEMIIKAGNVDWKITNNDDDDGDHNAIMFGSHALRVDYKHQPHHRDDNSNSNEESTTAAATTEEAEMTAQWISLHRQPHSCHGATHISLWYKRINRNDSMDDGSNNYKRKAATSITTDENNHTDTNVSEGPSMNSTTNIFATFDDTVRLRVFLLTEKDSTTTISQNCHDEIEMTTTTTMKHGVGA